MVIDFVLSHNDLLKIFHSVSNFFRLLIFLGIILDFSAVVLGVLYQFVWNISAIEIMSIVCGAVGGAITVLYALNFYCFT